VPDLPPHASLEHLRKQAKKRNRGHHIGLSRAQHEIAREYGFDSWPRPGLRNNRADDGDYPGTVEVLLAAGAPTRHSGPTGHADG
jgi:hypothetical protein